MIILALKRIASSGVVTPEMWLSMGLDYNETLGQEFGLSHLVNSNDASLPTVNVGIRQNAQGREEIVIQYFPIFYIEEMHQVTTVDESGMEHTFNVPLPVDEETYKEYANIFYKSINEKWNNRTVNIQGIDAKVVLEMDESMRKGTRTTNNVHIIRQDVKGQNVVWDAFVWRKESKLRINLRPTNTEQLEEAARHEFGHVVGNFDAYGYNQNKVGKFFFEGLEHVYLEDPGGEKNPHVLESVSAINVMDFLRDEVEVEDINIEMMLYAFSENRLQSFYPSIVGGTSQALYR